MRPIKPATPLDIAKLFLLGAVWGSAFLGIALALEGFPPVSVAAGRIALAALVLAAIAGLRRDPWPRDGTTWAMLAVIGLFNSALPFSLIGWAQQHIESSRAAILLATGPFVALLLSHLFTGDDRLTAAKLAGMALGFVGVAILVGFDASAGGRVAVLGQLAVVAAAACYAIGGLMTRLVAHVPPVIWSGAVLLAAAGYMVPAALLIDRPWTLAPGPGAVAALLFLGLAPTGLAYFLRFQLIRDCGTVFVSQTSYLIPLFGVLWGWLFLREVPSPAIWGALALILAGIAVSRLDPARRARPAPDLAPGPGD